MHDALDSTLAWWIAGPILGLVIVSFLALANKRFGVLGGVTDLVQGSAEGRGLRSWRTLCSWASCSAASPTRSSPANPTQARATPGSTRIARSGATWQCWSVRVC